MATPDVGDIWAEEYQFNDFTIFHKDIKSTPLFGVGIGYDTGHYFRFDITGEYRGKSLFVAQDKYPGSDGFNIVDPTIPGNFNPGTNEWTADIDLGPRPEGRQRSQQWRCLRQGQHRDQLRLGGLWRSFL